MSDRPALRLLSGGFDPEVRLRAPALWLRRGAGRHAQQRVLDEARFEEVP